jgi:hypothetical protein
MSEVANDTIPPDVLPDVYREKVNVPTSRYHVGMVPGGPAWNYTFFGINFPTYTSSFDKSDNEFKREGAVYELTVAQVRKIREAIANRIVRWAFYPDDYRDAKRAGTKASATIHDVRTRGFEPERGDEPLVKYIYFKPAPPEAVANPLPAATFAALDDAIRAAELAELEAATDPVDAKTRAKHGALRAAGLTLGQSDQL